MKMSSTPIEERFDSKFKIRTGMVSCSDGKSKPMPVRLHLTMELIKVQREETIIPEMKPLNTKLERMVQIRREKIGGLGLSIKGGAEHKLPILISRIYKDQAADRTGELFVGDAIIKVNGEYITACPHDDAVNILKNAGDLVVLTVKHYKATTPFLQKQEEHLKNNLNTNIHNANGVKHHENRNNFNVNDNKNSNGNSNNLCDLMETQCSTTTTTVLSRPTSLYSDNSDENGGGSSSSGGGGGIQNQWVDVVVVPLMMAYVTRYITGTDKLRPNFSFEVRGLHGVSTGIIYCDDTAVLSQWLKYITDNICSLTNLQMKLYNRNFGSADRIQYMSWVHEGVVNTLRWHSYVPRFLALKGADLILFDAPPLNLYDWDKSLVMYKVYQTMFRSIKESEHVDERQHCFLIQTSGQESRYFSVETRQELLRIENAWQNAVSSAVMKLGSKSFTVNFNGKLSALTLDWHLGFVLKENDTRRVQWQYRFSHLRGSSDDGKSKLKLLFQNSQTKVIDTREVDCTCLQSLLFCMHSFLTAKVAVVDPGFLKSIGK